MNTSPFEWAEISDLFLPEDRSGLAKDFPMQPFRLVKGFDGEKEWEYWARPLISMDGSSALPGGLQPNWLALLDDLRSPSYRDLLSVATGRDLSHAPIEVNAFHYGRHAHLGPHKDLPEKLVTHVLYFNAVWTGVGGEFLVLSSDQPHDRVATIPPVSGSSSLIVRSECSWHAVADVAGSAESRRSITVTFYADGACSTMWPEGSAFEMKNMNSSGEPEGVVGLWSPGASLLTSG